VETKTLTLGDVARRLGEPLWRVRRLFETGILPPARRVGPYRFFHEDDVEAIRPQTGPQPAA
jgi:hypothetical protein